MKKENILFIIALVVAITLTHLFDVYTIQNIYINQEEEKCEKAGGEFRSFRWADSDEIIGYDCYSISKEIKLN